MPPKVDRAWFIPDRIWINDERGLIRAVDRLTEPRRWARAVATDVVIVTQFDGGETVWPSTRGRRPTCSSSQPSLMRDMIAALDVRAGHHVVEIGAGTGYNAALLANKVGPTGQVTSVEIDPILAEQARKSLSAHDFPVEILVGDATTIPIPAADRIIVTAAIARGHLPESWVNALPDDGILIAPIDYELTRIVKHPNAAPTREYLEDVSFMALRHKTPRAS